MCHPDYDRRSKWEARNSEILLFSYLAQNRTAATWVVVVHVSYATLRILLELRLGYTEFLHEAIVDSFSTLASKEDVTLLATGSLISKPYDRIDELRISLECISKEAEVDTILVAERPAVDWEGYEERNSRNDILWRNFTVESSL